MFVSSEAWQNFLVGSIEVFSFRFSLRFKMFMFLSKALHCIRSYQSRDKSACVYAFRGEIHLRPTFHPGGAAVQQRMLIARQGQSESLISPDSGPAQTEWPDSSPLRKRMLTLKKGCGNEFLLIEFVSLLSSDYRIDIIS